MQNLATLIQNDEYLRQRIAPRPGDYFYLSLSDLFIALQEFKTNENITILDYGSGGSPYRSLFPNADYRRADYLQAEGDELDYVLDEESAVPEADQSFDFILSTQVAEHVKNPAKYFAECYRLLKPNGTLVCTTHGSFPDHGCPYDFQRWTADGLCRDIEQAGFEIERMAKLTTGARAFFTILDMSNDHLRLPRTSFLGASFYVLAVIYQNRKAAVHRYLDRSRPEERLVTNKEYKHNLYIGLIGIGRKQLK